MKVFEKRMNTILVTGWKEDPGHTMEYVLEGERIRAIWGIGQRIAVFHIHGLPILGYRGPAVSQRGLRERWRAQL